jgi:hypothetical protein
MNSKYLACSSDRGTIHIFSLATSNKKFKEKISEEKHEEDKPEEAPKNQKSIWDKMTKIIPLPKYFKSEWSFAQFRIPDSKAICAFGSNNSIIGIIFIKLVVSNEGRYYLANFDPKNGGECTKLAESNLHIGNKETLI